ncbi:S-arrestin [Taenia solium]|eukprot:TsM_001095100 transcript=TsM_001095100 gene=TsM_001095100
MSSKSASKKGGTKLKDSKGSKASGKAKGSKDSKGKEKCTLSPEELDQLLFGRKLCEDVDVVFTKKSKNLALFCQKIHIYEVWNRLPEIFTDMNPQGDNGGKTSTSKASNKSKGSKGSKGSKAKDSEKSKGKKATKGGKNSGSKSKGSKEPNKGDKEPKERSYDDPIVIEDRADMPEYEGAMLVGAVAFPYCLCQNGEKIFVEVNADFVYCDYAKVPPFPASVRCKTRCYKDIYYIFPLNIDRMPPFLTFTQNIAAKVQEEYPSGWHIAPFVFDLTGKPDSVVFTRPYYMEQNTGLFWTVRAFAGMAELCIPLPENEVSMNFHKFTIVPVAKPSLQRPSISLDYNRWSCMEDQGTLSLSATLSKDVYYQGEEIDVTVSISNDSARHTVVALTVCVEQTYKFNSEIPHDNSIPLATTFVRSGEMGLPVGPKNKGWLNTFNLRPLYDPTKYNLVVDGRMSRDKKLCLAESTVIVRQEWVEIEEPPPLVAEGDKTKPKKESKGSKGSKGKGKGGKDSKSANKSKKSDSKEKGSKKGKSKGGKTSKAPGEPKDADQTPAEAEEKPQDKEQECKAPRYVQRNTVTDRQDCRIIDVSYQVVVRLTLGNEGGQPMVRVPFALTRNSRYIDRLPLRMPPVFAKVTMP